jgi:hypothetical protein
MWQVSWIRTVNKIQAQWIRDFYPQVDSEKQNVLIIAKEREKIDYISSLDDNNKWSTSVNSERRYITKISLQNFVPKHLLSHLIERRSQKTRLRSDMAVTGKEILTRIRWFQLRNLDGRLPPYGFDFANVKQGTISERMLEFFETINAWPTKQSIWLGSRSVSRRDEGMHWWTYSIDAAMFLLSFSLGQDALDEETTSALSHTMIEERCAIGLSFWTHTEKDLSCGKYSSRPMNSD